MTKLIRKIQLYLVWSCRIVATDNRNWFKKRGIPHFGKKRKGVLYEGVSTSFRNPKVKEQEIILLYLIHKTSLKSHYAKLHFCLTCYWLSTAQNYTIGRKSVILRFNQNCPIFLICIESLNDRLHLAVMFMVRFFLRNVFSL